MLSKIFGTALAVLVVFSICGALPGIANVEPVSGSSGNIIYVPDNFTTIQQAVNAASSGDTIIVRDGTYYENVDVNTANLTIQSENGTANCVVSASSSSDHVFDVTANYVNITGFMVENATGYPKAGIYLKTVNHCNISSNNVTNNRYGIYLNSASNNNTLTNNTANSNGWGIYLNSASNNNTLTNNTANWNNYDGIWLRYSSNNNTLTNNTASNNTDDGIRLYSSSNNMLTNNTVSNNGNGILLASSSDNTLANNTMSGNDYNFRVGGSSLSDYIQDIDTSNKVDGKPIYYWVNHQDEQVPADAGFVGVVNSTNITVRDLILTKNKEGVLFAYTENSRVENVTASNNGNGILLTSSSSNTLTNNTASSNTQHGVYLGSSSSNNTLTNNTANSNDYGVYLYSSSSNNTLTNNTANSNGWGIYLWSSSDNTFTNNTANWNNYDGIWLRYSSNNNTLANNTASNNTGGISLSVSHNNTLTNNTASSNGWYGINLAASSNNTLTNNTANSNLYGIWLSHSSNNTLTNNTANSNGWGIYLYYLDNNNTFTSNIASNNTYYGIRMDSASNNTIYNNYFNNTNNAWDNGNNTWNTTKTSGTNIIGGPYLGGNYWSDYNGSDTNGDGFGDTPYNITGGSNKDYLPLVLTGTLEGHITFPMARVGSLVEPFTVKLFESGNFSNVIWSGNRTTNSTGVFNITGLTSDTYDIGIKSAICVSEVNFSVMLSPGTNVVDFTIRSGDVDGSDYVDMGDYSAFATAFNTLPSDGKWDANADLDRSGYIDMGDYSMFSTYFNELGDAYGQF